ncbi:hypothetical protein APR50_03870 [Variovorax paradoxus]|jgi:hypothetical protein|uniref:NrsF family protein n=1 Tax=Variovorax paradoxus TaxID=34073 RepID=UPI0006E69028|nr:hypothetical protein APR52_16520 [Variovorax paradoxus]KPV11212.1 hypothetical protein APR50_03870 [Variovorax paradoxus]KPV13121.1 hypothetical protein APR49_04440 [Variovorax paradoxus]KPV21229.1 hypothetical protein APR51_14430 [Variovorax paradoxus]KPV26796.1 hypothetical protein APR47_32490 [Variovorax paradoxus]
MKTDDLVSFLATGITPVRPHATTRRLAAAVALGLLASVLIVASRFHFRSDLASAVFLPMFQIKMFFFAAIGWAGFVMTWRLAHPGGRAGRAWLGLVLPVAAICLLALAAVAQAEPGERLVLIMRGDWKSCSAAILIAAVPPMIAGFAALRTLGPTRPMLAGAAVGAMSGGLGGVAYALHCPQLVSPYWAMWYIPAIGCTVGVGALLGHRLLRW